MKKSITSILALALIAMQVVSCQPDPGPQPTTPTTTTSTPTTPGTAPTTIAGQEQMLVGNWIMRKTITITEVTQDGVTKDSVVRYQNHYSPSTCFLELTNTASSVGNSYKVANGGILCVAQSNGYWKVPNLNQLDFNMGIYVIDHLTADSLVIYTSYSGTKTKYVFNKTGIQPGLTLIEQQIAGTWILDSSKGDYNLAMTYPANTSGTFTTQWNTTINTGWTMTGFSGYFGFSTWQEVQGRFSTGQHYKIETLTANRFVFSQLNPVPNTLYRFYMHR